MTRYSLLEMALKLTRTLLVAYAMWLLLLFVLQRKMVFPGAGDPGDERLASYYDDLERLWIDTDEGRVEAWLLRAPGATAEKPAGAVIVAHGNAELIESIGPSMEGFRKLGYHVLIPEYRGYGRSAGSPSQASITRDFVAFRDRLAEREDVRAGRMVYFGRSLGGGVVCQLAAQRPPQAMILQSTFSSVTDMALKRLAPPFLVKDPFDNEEVLRGYGGPVLVIHGDHDTMISPSNADVLVAASKNATKILYSADHNDCPPDWDRFYEDIRRFLEAQLPPAS